MQMQIQVQVQVQVQEQEQEQVQEQEQEQEQRQKLKCRDLSATPRQTTPFGQRPPDGDPGRRAASVEMTGLYLSGNSSSMGGEMMREYV